MLKTVLLIIAAAYCCQFVPTMAEILLATQPGGLEAVAVSPGSIEVFWTPGQAGTEFPVFRDGEEVALVDASNGRWRDDGLAANRLYAYSVGGATVAEKSYPAFPASAEYDVVVVGATASGVAAAVTAARLGRTVALIEETNRLGGMGSNGLGNTDIRNVASSSGFFDEYRTRIASYYGSGNGLRFEPRVANAVMKSLLYEEPKISLFRQTRFLSAIIERGRIGGIKAVHLPTQQEGTLRGRITIDATVEGDVAASAGCVYRVGREPRSEREPHGGHIYFDNSTLEILEGSTGEGDSKIQSYAYLMVVKDYGEGADKRIPMPLGYDPEEFRPSPSWEKSWAYSSGRLPNNKYEINQHAFGTDLPGINYNYPFEGPDGRADICDQYRIRALQYLYYLQNELGKSHIGLPEDEYRAEGGWPTTLYVREARRVEGLITVDETDILSAPENRRRDSITIGDYALDSHAMEKLTDPTARHRGEGEFYLGKITPWFQVPLGIIIPKNTNGLLVTSAISATHVAYGAIRMEPTRMGLGQAAGTLAHLSLFYNREPAAVPISVVQDKLLSQKAYVTRFLDVNKNTRHFKAIQWLGLVGFFEEDRFRPEELLTRVEALQIMRTLTARETSRDAFPDQTVLRAPDGPITRSEFAELLVKTKQTTSDHWRPLRPQGRYKDLSAGSSEEMYAEILYRHHIRASNWTPPPTLETSYDLFHSEASITRADAAFAVYLAHRPRLFRQ